MARPSPALTRALFHSFSSSSSAHFAPRPTSLSRSFASTSRYAQDKPASVPIQLISKIRTARPGTPLSLARSALQAANNDLDGALAWIAEQAKESGAAKAEKLASRTAEQGLVAVAVLADGSGGVGVRASLVEMRCETDFVARTDEFRELTEGIARSLAYFAEPSQQPVLSRLDVKGAQLLETPVVPAPSKVAQLAETEDHKNLGGETVKTSIASIVSRLGENIHLHRAASISLEPVLPSASSSSQQPVYLASSYLHLSKTPSAAAAADGVQSGALGGLLLARLSSQDAPAVDPTEVKGLLRALSRQVVAMPTSSVVPLEGAKPLEEGEPSTALYEQQLITMAPSAKFEFEAGSSVGKVLEQWSKVRGLKGEKGLEVVGLERWELGAAEEQA
ncbi:hypothetical protein JCM6882_003349 [Rhodosporidiobolus microsporus]